MSQSAWNEARSDLCQRAIEASDDSMFKYLSFFAAIHAAAITAIANESIGLPAYLGSGAGSTVAFVVVATTGSLAGLLCLLIGRGLHDAAVQHSEAIRYGGKKDGPENFFDRIYGQTTADIWNLTTLLSGAGRLFPRHVRMGGAVTGMGIVWGVFLVDVTTGLSHLLISGSPVDIGGVADEVAMLWGGSLVLAGVAILLQMLASAWMRSR